jgi:hypothetical protein
MGGIILEEGEGMGERDGAKEEKRGKGRNSRKEEGIGVL